MARAPQTDWVSHEEDSQELVTGEAVALDLRASSFVLRGAGAIIDWVVYFGGYIAILLILLNFAGQWGLDEALTQAISIIGVPLCLVVIPAVVETLSQGKSLGKLAIGARIVRDDGGSIGLRHALIRSLIGFFEIFATLGGIAAFAGLLNSKAKRIGDLVAGTYSQNERVSQEVPPVWGVPVELMQWATTADVAKMPDSLARRVTQFLSQANGFTPLSRDRHSRELANEVAVFVSPVPAANAELFLAAVTAKRRERETAALMLQKSGRAALGPVLEGMPRGFPDRG